MPHCKKEKKKITSHNTERWTWVYIYIYNRYTLVFIYI